MLKIKQQSGATLLEVLVTVAILSVSLLAMALLQNHSLNLNQSALNRSQANTLAYKMIERIRINAGPQGENLSAYNLNYSDTFEPDSEDSTPSGPQVEVRSWLRELRSLLPEGKGEIQCSASTSLCTVSIRWSEAFAFGEDENEQQGSESFSEFSFQSQL